MTTSNRRNRYNNIGRWSHSNAHQNSINIKHDCRLYLIEEIIRIYMHVRLEPTELKTPALTKFIKSQSDEVLCPEAAKKMGQSEMELLLDKDSVVTRRTPIDGALQKLVPQLMRESKLHLSHYPSLAGHHGQRRIYETMHRDYYWPKMAQNVYHSLSPASAVK